MVCGDDNQKLSGESSLLLTSAQGVDLTLECGDRVDQLRVTFDRLREERIDLLRVERGLA